MVWPADDTFPGTRQRRRLGSPEKKNRSGGGENLESERDEDSQDRGGILTSRRPEGGKGAAFTLLWRRGSQNLLSSPTAQIRTMTIRYAAATVAMRFPAQAARELLHRPHIVNQVLSSGTDSSIVAAGAFSSKEEEEEEEEEENPVH
ncbi:hypothetical protein ACJRO7_026432 [Eucalyptus globulus]|uniref:Uncharacterized protein n=1 Tax=Eucalyptus globulus TaxID=34317 RepID=A0ABD3JSW3_EUCGL